MAARTIYGTHGIDPYECRRPPILDEDLDNAGLVRDVALILDHAAYALAGTTTWRRPETGLGACLDAVAKACRRRLGGSRLTTDDLSEALDAAAEALRAAANEVERRVDAGEGS